MFFIRTAGKQDLEKISALLAETWHDTYDRIYGPDKVADITAAWHSVEALKTQLARPGSEFIVADDGERIGGVAFAAMADAKAKTVMLHQLYVRPGCQGQGTGAMLLAEIVEAFPDASTLRIEVEPANEKAVSFYEAKGFEKVGETSDCGVTGNKSGIPAAIYERPLP
ncbi:ribosomal protein S18 acetylase RimI-like enzyme [Breoghania corrubedonensis]|uniref:Ribosomal protein S18 acetylase RimI-like enzyme n=1 Tax=Breoghania corrubedonensis TaxID=665038 RepID=A0A2T5V7D7_9HYPH|nr:GNAT family N-acetyltransferase [Breoghania corrubedonensis]PTW59669.1 ribosomal protein S18 acetylase RimI-like enzyme [Breoghania corrubedonensis]